MDLCISVIQVLHGDFWRKRADSLLRSVRRVMFRVAFYGYFIGLQYAYYLTQTKLLVFHARDPGKKSRGSGRRCQPKLPNADLPNDRTPVLPNGSIVAIVVNRPSHRK